MAKKSISKRLLNEKKESMTDNEFFMSKTLRTHFETIIEGVCKSYRRLIRIHIKDKGEFVAFTDGNSITVNLDTKWIRMQKTRVDKYFVIIGIILHECSHILHTNFKLSERSMTFLADNSLYPVIEVSDELRSIFARNLGRCFLGFYKTLDNCIEDGYIEKKIIRMVPGYGECLLKVRKLHLFGSTATTYEDAVRNASESGERVDRKYWLINLVLNYAKFNIVNTGDYRDDLTAVFEEARKLLKKAVSTDDPLARKKQVNRIFNILASFIVNELRGDASLSKSGMADDECKTDIPGISDEASDDAISDEMSRLDDMTKCFSERSMHTPTEPPKDTPDTECDPKTECEGTYEESIHDKDSGTDDVNLSYLEDKSAEEAVAREIHSKVLKEMKRIADDTSKERTDRFPSLTTYPDPSGTAEERYLNEHSALDRIAKRVVNNLDKVIKERLKGDKLNGLYSGTHLDSAHLYRKDKKIFSRKILPQDKPDMEVCVLVDCSGSMSVNERIEQARKCAYITWKFCNTMDIPCSVYGHTTDPSEKHVKMICVAHKDNVDSDDPKRIFGLNAERNNRDGWAVNFCAESLARSDAASRMLLIISDGIPEAPGYGFIDGQKDCQAVVKRYKDKGISVITAGIDSCADDIRRVYQEGIPANDAAVFLDYSDMTMLPKAFATIIKSELL